MTHVLLFLLLFAGLLWTSVKSCLARKEQTVSCVNQNITSTCKNAKHRVTKVLRLTLDHFDTLLKSRDNLKVIHLFRDPRAIMNSRLEAEWYPSKDLLSNAESLCRKMIFDYRIGRKLLKKYPNRFRFLYYEDLTDEPLDKIKTLYRYIGLPLGEPKYSLVETSNVSDSSKSKVLTQREKNTAFWWRKKLQWDLVIKMDNLCKDVYDELGYIAFSNYDKMQNLTYPSVKIPQEYVLI